MNNRYIPILLHHYYQLFVPGVLTNIFVFLEPSITFFTTYFQLFLGLSFFVSSLELLQHLFFKSAQTIANSTRSSSLSFPRILYCGLPHHLSHV